MNAQRAENAELIGYCETALAQRGQGISAAEAAPRVSAANFTIPTTAVADAARLISSLPPVGELSNGLERRRLQAHPISTLGELWRLFVTCGFSSVENSEEGSPLDRFITAQGPLFDLAYVRKMSCDPDWVTSEILAHVPRMAGNKRRLVLGSFARFELTGAAPVTPLADICRKGESLSVFCLLARGDTSDSDLARSATFSNSLDPAPFPRIGNKQLRNILVNSGLARNVVPLDSRWQRFFGSALPVTSQILADKMRYLAIEDVLRRALLSISHERPDIDNLAVLDAIVFQSMSKNGMAGGGWSGAGLPDDELAELESADDSDYTRRPFGSTLWRPAPWWPGNLPRSASGGRIASAVHSAVAEIQTWPVLRRLSIPSFQAPLSQEIQPSVARSPFYRAFSKA